MHYMRQMAVITPYAQFLFKFVSDAPEYVYMYISIRILPPGTTMRDHLIQLFSLAARMSL